ncbi:MAG TPA: lamin tail domain-containing protein [Chitinophagaceae bacterium]|nr:lamin tail domain-containing protein [Chitinophagaceae bacterium]
MVILLTVCIPVVASTQNRYDVIIDEIMADPSPQVSLPNSEWIELKNVSGAVINLQGWRIGDAGGQSGTMPNFNLQADSFVIICPASAAASMSAFGTAISVTSFPALGNDGDQLFLRAPGGHTIHAVAYSTSWYQNQLKRDGGWTLEMIDTNTPCAGVGNWKASIDPSGGTPGKKNSVEAVNTDYSGPRLRYAYTLDSVTIIAVYEDPVDSVTGAAIRNYTIDGGLSIKTAVALAPLFNTVQLELNNAMAINFVYTITAANVVDCSNNLIGSENKARVGLPVDALQADVVINEILFNPKSNGFDYVEYYNRSNKIFDASKMFVANRNTVGAISSIKQIAVTPFYVFPGDYFVVTQDAVSLGINYVVKNAKAVIALSSLPSYPDDEGDVILLNGQGKVIDEVKYNDDWHFKLIDDREGVSLERIDPGDSSQDPANWHSAASTVGYGTPTYKNSQYKQSPLIDATIQITPRIFSPDNDGYDDMATVQYKMPAPGYVANITIYDSQGRPVRYLVKNGTLGINGQWNWDGLDEKNAKLPIGTYIIYAEIFNLRGHKQYYKNAVVLARKLN